MADFFQILCDDARRLALPFLVGGGHAVNSYGVGRTTYDVDLIIPESEAPRWREYWEGRDYACYYEDANYCRLSHQSLFPVDLLFMGAETFRKLFEGSQERQISGSLLPVPNALSLLAMKLHAMNNHKRLKLQKDLPQVLDLIERAEIEVESPEFQQILTRYAPEKIIRLIQDYFQDRQN
jgi:hypothetical protein